MPWRKRCWTPLLLKLCSLSSQALLSASVLAGVACWIGWLGGNSLASGKDLWAFPGVVGMVGAGLNLGGRFLSWQGWGDSSSEPSALQLLLLSRLGGDRDRQSESDCESVLLLEVVVLLSSSELQLWCLEAEERQLQFSVVSAVTMVGLSFTGVLCDAGTGLSSATACISSFTVGLSWDWDVCAAEAAFLGFRAARGVEWRGLHMSSVRSMMARLLDGVGSVFVSSQVKSMISCGVGAAMSMTCPARSLCYSGTVASVQEGKGQPA